MRNIILLCVLFSFIVVSDILSQGLINDKLRLSRGATLRVEIAGISGFLFDSTLTKKFMSPIKVNKYKSYWWIDSCEIIVIEKEIKNLLVNNYDKAIDDKYPHYIRQYFPFINKKGEMIIVITLSYLIEDEKDDVIKRLSLFPRYVFDDAVNYLALKFNYSRKLWVTSARTNPSQLR